MDPISVYLVDDHPILREGLRRLLEQDDGVQVVGEAGSGEDAVGGVLQTSPQVVLIDIKLPGINGVETTRRLLVQDPQVRVVILSSFGDQYLSQAIQAGACGYILKSSPYSELAKAVRQAAGGQAPIDAALSGLLVSRFADMARGSELGGLSHRQRDMLLMLADGLSSKEITAQLFISEATLKREFRNIFNTLGVNDRAQALAEAYRRNLI